MGKNKRQRRGGGEMKKMKIDPTSHTPRQCPSRELIYLGKYLDDKTGFLFFSTKSINYGIFLILGEEWTEDDAIPVLEWIDNHQEFLCEDPTCMAFFI